MDVGNPVEATLVATAFLVCHHCDKDVVRMNPRVFDVVCVGEATDDVFGGMDAAPLRIGGGEGGGGGSARVVCLVDDSDFGGAEFAQITDEGCQGHSLAFAVGTFAQQECFPDFTVFEELGWELFAAEARCVDELDDSIQFFRVLVVGKAGEGWIGGWLEWSLCDGVDFLDGVEEVFDGGSAPQQRILG